MLLAIRSFVYEPMDSLERATSPLLGHLMEINCWEHHQLSDQTFDGQEPRDFAMCRVVFEEE